MKFQKYVLPVCDPFKNRANRLLGITYDVYKDEGLETLIQNIEEIKGNK